jgi:hypothetical protein
MNETYTSYGVYYRHGSSGPGPVTRQIYIYRWEYLDKNMETTSGIDAVYTDSYESFLILLKHWSNQQPGRWVYTEFDFPVPQQKESVAMAKVTIKMEKVKKMVETEVTVKTYQLELSEAEAKTLVAVGSFTGGCPETSIRKYTDKIRDSLRVAGVPDVVGSESVREDLFFKNNTAHLVE